MENQNKQSLKLTWTNEDGSQHSLNPRLVAKQELNQLQVDNIIDLHKHKDQILSQMKTATQKKTLRELAQKITNIEFNLQALWGFSQDENFHYWFEVPQCDCPKMDNRDRYGTSHRIINPHCKIHGK